MAKRASVPGPVEGPWALPEGWRWERLPQAAEICDHLRRPINNAERLKRNEGKSPGELYPYYGATGQAGAIDGYLADGEYILLGEDGAPFLDPFKVKAYPVSGRFWVNNHALVLLGKPHLDARLLLHWLNTIKYEPFVNGTTRLKLTQGAMMEMPVPVPPKDIQLSLASRIDELFDDIDDGEAALARARDDLATWRKALLKAAVTGGLTADWRAANPADETGVDLLARILAERRSKPNAKGKQPVEAVQREDDTARRLPQGWSWCGPNQIVEWSSGKFIPDRSMNGGDVPVYGGNGIAGYHDEPLVRVPTLVIGRVGHYCGNAYATDGAAWISDNAIYASKVATGIEVDYLRLVFEQVNLRRMAQGGAQPFVSQTLLNSISIPLPGAEEQTVILKAVEDGLAEAQELELFIEGANAHSSTLRQSILTAAFRGDLA